MAKDFKIDFDAPLHGFCFDKNKTTKEKFETLLAEVIGELSRIKLGRGKNVLIWRGEYTNTYGQVLWVAGVSHVTSSPVLQTITKPFTDSDLLQDWGSWNRIDTGCEPFLLWTPTTLWSFSVDPDLKEIALGGHTFPVQPLRYVHSPPPSIATSFDADFQQIDAGLRSFLKNWQQEHGERACDNWPDVIEKTTELLGRNDGNITFNILRWICTELIRLPVYEIEMQDLGRTVVRSVWHDLGDEYAITHETVFIAINKNLSKSNRFLALAHELGHFAFHFPVLSFMAKMFAAIQQDPSGEQRVAAILNKEWMAHYTRWLEMRADIFASYVFFPFYSDSGLERIFEHTVGNAVRPDGQRLIWLREFFYPGKDRLGWAHVNGISEDGYLERVKMTERDYSPSMSCFDRMSWCLFNRVTKLKELNAEENDINGHVAKAASALFKPAAGEQQIQNIRGTHLISRFSFKDFLSELPKREWWEPVMVRPDEVSEPMGYWGLVPAPFTEQNSTEMLWVRWEARMEASQYSLDSWLARARGENFALMLFPLSPLDKHIQQKVNKL